MDSSVSTVLLSIIFATQFIYLFSFTNTYRMMCAFAQIYCRQKIEAFMGGSIAKVTKDFNFLKITVGTDCYIIPYSMDLDFHVRSVWGINRDSTDSMADETLTRIPWMSGCKIRFTPRELGYDEVIIRYDDDSVPPERRVFSDQMIDN